MTITSRRVTSITMLFLLGLLSAACSADQTTAEPTDVIIPKPPRAQVVNSSGARIDRVVVLGVTFTENLSYNTLLYSADNGSYCGDGCSTRFVEIAESASAIMIGQTAAAGATSAGSLGPFLKDRSYAINIRLAGGRYCAELWQRTDTDPVFNQDTTRVLLTTTC